MLLIPDLSCCQNLSAPSQAIVLCPVTRVVPGAKATVYVDQRVVLGRSQRSHLCPRRLPAKRSCRWVVKLALSPSLIVPQKAALNFQIFVCLLVLARGKRIKFKFGEMRPASFVSHCGSD